MQTKPLKFITINTKICTPMSNIVLDGLFFLLDVQDECVRYHSIVFMIGESECATPIIYFPYNLTFYNLLSCRWEKISDPKSIAEILSQVYADHSTNVDNVFSRIVETTRHPAAAASFASIMFAPQGELSFSETLSR